MKSKFEWYLDPTAAEIERVWQQGILTVDANVLLDLYRYHAQTQENLLAAIEGFQDRVWISDQAAKEFIRNRKGVISSAEKTFREATLSLQELSKALDTGTASLRGHRLVPRASLDDLGKKLESALSEARTAIQAAHDGHPNYLQNDAILDRLLKVFNGRVEAAPDENLRGELMMEGERRKLAKIPPGFMDTDKDSDRPYGDFILWRQTLDFARSSSKPIVFVTSERKEDWWETHSGKRVGPRAELLEEAFLYAGQRVLIYQTDFFLQTASAQAGKSVNTAAVEEIRALSASRARRRVEDAAVRVRQLVDEASIFDNTGKLEIELLRPVFMMTGSGAFNPRLEDVPNLRAEVVSSPAEAPLLLVRAGTGTKFDFNVHMKSGEKGVPLPVGIYVVKYAADAWGDLMEGIELDEV